jgi:hypothetical protein
LSLLSTFFATPSFDKYYHICQRLSKTRRIIKREPGFLEVAKKLHRKGKFAIALVKLKVAEKNSSISRNIGG